MPLTTKQKKIILTAIVQIQYRYRWKRRQYYENDKTRRLVYQTLLHIMYKIQQQFNSNVYTQEQYNRLMHQLEKYSVDYQKLVNDSRNSVSGFHRSFTIDCSLFVSKLMSITVNIGLELEYLLPLFGDQGINNTPLQSFYHNFFIPTSCHRLVLKENNYEIDESIHKDYKSKASSIPQSSILSKKKKNQDKNTDKTPKKFGSDGNDDYQTLKEDCKVATKKFTSSSEPFCIKSQNGKSLVETVFGARLYYKITNSVLVMNGYFREDPLNLSRMSGSFQKKHELLESKLDTINNVNSYFKQAFIKQISVRDFIILNTDELASTCIKYYKDLQRLKQKTISSLVKEFLGASLDQQRQILTLFLLTESDTDTQYLAYLMFDMISNESYLLKPQPIAEQVYSSLHWSVQKLFKIALQNVNKYTNRLINFNEDDIPYEKRICLLKAPDHVKAKAMEKYKEVSQKTNESASKAQQYLDGILRIPFGIYYKESILCFLAEFSSRFSLLLEGSIQSIDSNDEELLKLCKETQSYKRLTSNSIENFFTQISKDSITSPVDLSTLDSYTKCCQAVKTLKNSTGLKKLVVDGKTIVLSKTVKGKKISVDFEELRSQIVSFINSQSECQSQHQSEGLVWGKFQKLQLEWNSYLVKKQKYLQQSRRYLDNAVHGHKEAKNQLERIIAQWMNGEMSGYCFGFEGPPGTGKTSLAKKGLTKCLQDEDGKNRPFSFIAIGGSSNGATLEGHSYTYVGSTWGRIVDILMETHCMNPIIFVDELDKVSNTEHGKELIGILTHLTDSTQNEEFCDKYFSGVKLDLSKVLFIFSYNDPEKIDPILLDRIHRVQFKPLKKRDKIIIAHRYILPEIYQTVGFRRGIDEECDIIFPDEVLEFIIDNYTFEAGARKFREKLFEIVREINLRWLMGQKINNETIVFPHTVSIEFLTRDIFSDRQKIHVKKISTYPRIGLVNGLYATATGIGGITIIESFRVPSNDRLGLELTGKQGDVMRESMKVAKTVAWNMLPPEVKVQINQQWNRTGNFGMHIHCPEGATPKDGPSAGAAITVAIISLLANLPVNNLVAMTGEIDLNGSVHAIGGLETKLDGAKKAGVKVALCPKLNGDDLARIKRDDPHLIGDDFKVVMVANIWEVIPYVFPDAPYQFINYTVKAGAVIPEYLSATEVLLDASRLAKKNQQIRWEQSSGDSLTIIANPTAMKTNVTGLGLGEYIFNLYVEDEKHQIKIAIPKAPQAVITTESIWKGTTGWLDGGHSEGDIKNYQWSLVSGPESSEEDKKTDFDSPKSIRTRVDNLNIGVYMFELEIYDKFYRSHKTRFQVSVVNQTEIV